MAPPFSSCATKGLDLKLPWAHKTVARGAFHYDARTESEQQLNPIDKKLKRVRDPQSVAKSLKENRVQTGWRGIARMAGRTRMSTAQGIPSHNREGYSHI